MAAASNERLEFLGDSILGFVVADALYRSLPDRPEGDLTRIRADLVGVSAALAKAAAGLRLGEFLLLGRGEEQGGGTPPRQHCGRCGGIHSGSGLFGRRL